ncbi:B3 domain-containing protein Os01g0234100-like [Macadamia integrifolia]|uniref:B3 domain-containing protein Os01g0234100-like n=1 Tax=Macadamia integrifolia TaxID=60698 RepID=UPI001C5016B1|nr:B3 domain-containing protein Os01g0234100-like [Macadamia integrifolia]XP_042497424.1 B3 domain-containing protein Os01g0234100-like [Macadamia integrifolia]
MAVEDEIEKKPELLDLYKSQNSMEDQKTQAQFSQARKLESPQYYTRKKQSGRKAKLFWVRKRYSAPPASLCSLDHLQAVAQKESMRSQSCKRKRATINQLYASDKAYLRVMERVKEVQSNLETGMPNFAKLMLRSHVTLGFWLGLPVRFCKLNLPKEDCILTLVDDGGKEYDTRYLADKTGLSGGWKGFSIAHNLAEGDAVVFQLIKATKFKVYIIRAKNLEVDEGDGKHSRSYPVSLLQENNQNASPPESVSNNGSPVGEQFENDSKEVGSDVLAGIRMSAAPVEFKDVKIFDNFSIIVNDLILDSQFPEHVRVKYYELCCSQKAFLHDQLLEGINCKLITGIISEIVNVADAIRACKLTTSQNDLKSWDKSLNAFEQLGMNVGFLRARLHRLISLAFESEGAMDSKIYNKAMLKRACLEEEMKNLEVKCMELIEVHARNDKEIERLKLKVDRHEMKFQSEVRAPW